MNKNLGVVWKDAWLGPSETFIRDQILAMPDWDFLKVGFHRTKAPLVEADFAPYKNDAMSWNLRKALGTRLFRRRYMDYIQKHGASVIHSHFLSGGVNAASLAGELGLPLVTTLHNARIGFSQTHIKAAFRRLYDRRLQRLLSIGSKFIAVSNYVADSAIRAGVPASKVEILHTGTPIVDQVTVSKRQGIVFVGRLIEMKGAADLLEAVARLPSTLRDVPVTIVGEGSQRAGLEELARELRLNIRFVGWVPSSELPQLLAQHQVFCAPSKANSLGVQEGFGMVFLEAALQTLPCVAYESGGVVDAVAAEETGLLVPEGDIEELSWALSVLLSDERLANELGEQGRARVERSFNISFQAKKLEGILSSPRGLV